MSADVHRRRMIRRRRRIGDYRRAWSTCRGLIWKIHPSVLTLAVAILLSCVLIGALEDRLRPVLLTAAKIQTQNTVTAIAERAIMSELERQSIQYLNLVRVERDSDGSITAITTDMTAMNQLRGTLVDVLLEHVSTIDEEAIAIPVGSLIDSELIWGRGPTIKVRSFTIGTVSAEFKSEFTSAGINQTLHKIWLDLSVPTTILLPGIQLEVSVDTMLCVAETVIVGKVPSYLQKAYG